MKTTSLLHSRSLALAALVTAALLALAPGRAAADPAAIFVSGYDNNGNAALIGYSATGAAPTGYTAPANFTNAEGVAYNPANGMLYVADVATNQIRTFNAANGVDTTSSTGFNKATGLSSPFGLAINAGVLYAANYNTNMITAYNAATGAMVTSGFTAPTGLNAPYGLAVNSTTLFVTNNGTNSLGAYNLTTGATVFSIGGLSGAVGVALYGNDLFVANDISNTVGEYDATTGAAINTSFIMGLNNPQGMAVLGNQLLVVNNGGSTVGAYGIPTTATLNNLPTSSNASFLTPNTPHFIVVVPEPSTWALLGVGVGALGLALRRRAAAATRA